MELHALISLLSLKINAYAIARTVADRVNEPERIIKANNRLRDVIALAKQIVEESEKEGL